MGPNITYVANKANIVYINNNGKITFTKDEFQQFVDKIWKQGYDVGYNEGYKDKDRSIQWPYWYYSNDITTTNAMKTPTSVTTSTTYFMENDNETTESN